MEYNTATLPNGLRVIHRKDPSAVIFCGYQIAAGTRHERPGQEGLAHFCEHTTFKGTSRHSSLQILNALESVGGELNAFTTKERTVYYAATMKEHLSRTIDLLGDIVFNSIYPQNEIDKEVEVICDEIESYNDSPAELIYDEFENIVHAGHPLGHNILGNAEGVRRFKTADALAFTREHYRTDNAIFFACGDIDFKWLLKQLVKTTPATPNQPIESSPSGGGQEGATHLPLNRGAEGLTFTMQTHQAHVMIGCRSYPINHPMRMPLYVMNNNLGGPAMNSRLNVCLRERNALVYTVESSAAFYTDTGTWSVYFGCDHHDIKHCLRLVRRELDKLMQRPLPARQLQAAKRQLKGQLGISTDNREQFAIDFGKSFLYNGWEKDIQQLFQRIDDVTAEQMQQVAQELFRPENLTTLIIK
ncbi:MAG: insulinase family protein [Prevotella sp.]|nr:insulinase family protein [Prevotella sp.]